MDQNPEEQLTCIWLCNKSVWGTSGAEEIKETPQSRSFLTSREGWMGLLDRKMWEEYSGWMCWPEPRSGGTNGLGESWSSKFPGVGNHRARVWKGRGLEREVGASLGPTWNVTLHCLHLIIGSREPAEVWKKWWGICSLEHWKQFGEWFGASCSLPFFYWPVYRKWQVKCLRPSPGNGISPAFSFITEDNASHSDFYSHVQYGRL